MSDQSLPAPAAGDNEQHQGEIEYPTVKDVLCGRGGHSSCHVGNIQFRMLVENYKGAYAKASRFGKSQVADEVVQEWKNRGGRFLTRVDPSKGDESFWREIDKKEAVKKASQSLRERMPRDGFLNSSTNNATVTSAGLPNNRTNNPPHAMAAAAAAYQQASLMQQQQLQQQQWQQQQQQMQQEQQGSMFTTPSIATNMLQSLNAVAAASLATTAALVAAATVTNTPISTANVASGLASQSGPPMGSTALPAPSSSVPPTDSFTLAVLSRGSTCTQSAQTVAAPSIEPSMSSAISTTPAMTSTPSGATTLPTTRGTDSEGPPFRSHFSEWEFLQKQQREKQQQEHARKRKEQFEKRSASGFDPEEIIGVDDDDDDDDDVASSTKSRVPSSADRYPKPSLPSKKRKQKQSPDTMESTAGNSAVFACNQYKRHKPKRGVSCALPSEQQTESSSSASSRGDSDQESKESSRGESDGFESSKDSSTTQDAPSSDQGQSSGGSDQGQNSDQDSGGSSDGERTREKKKTTSFCKDRSSDDGRSDSSPSNLTKNVFDEGPTNGSSDDSAMERIMNKSIDSFSDTSSEFNMANASKRRKCHPPSYQRIHRNR